MASEQMMVAALGRPFTLGMLYDARKDELHTGFTLWDKKTLQENMSVQAQHSSAFEITASDSIESKFSLLEVDPSVKASFLGGLIEIEGSAEYLNNQKQFKNQSRVTLQYKATTAFKQLSMTHLEAKNKQNTELVKAESATHVVTGILYGAHAFFVFDSEKEDPSSIKDTQASMKAVIKKIPKLLTEKLTDEEKALTDKLSCKFHGDFILESNPTTFEDAVKTYTQLPNLLRQAEGNAVPLKVWLTPLKKFILTTVELKGEICPKLVNKAENALEDLRQAEIRCNDSLEEKVVDAKWRIENVPQIYNNLRKFQKLCKDYKSELQRTMEKKFPLIREGKEDDNSVKKLFEDREKSPFSYDNLNNWIKDKEEEISVIRSYVEMMAKTKTKKVSNQSELDREICAPDVDKIKIVSNQSELDKEIRTPDVDHVVCFVFTSVEPDDPFLEQMNKYLHSCHSHGSHSCKNEPLPTKDHWYTSQDVLSKMREKAKTFRDVSSGLGNNSRFTFIIAVLPNEKYKGATIYHYKDGRCTDDFSKPNIPDVKSVTERGDLMWYACDLNLDPRTANGYLTFSDRNKKATCGEWRDYPEYPERFDQRTQVLCKEGLTGRHYWEVEWSKGYGNNVGVGVTYQRIERKGNGCDSGLGSNDISWFIGEKKGYLSAWHNGQVWSDQVPPGGYNRVGVYLDWPAGTLTFYSVTSKTLSCLYSFQHRFTDAVYPGFWIYNKSNYAALCQV